MGGNYGNIRRGYTISFEFPHSLIENFEEGVEIHTRSIQLL